MVCLLGLAVALGGAALLGFCKDDACLEETHPGMRVGFAVMIVVGLAMCAMAKAIDATCEAVWSAVWSAVWGCLTCRPCRRNCCRGKQ